MKMKVRTFYKVRIGNSFKNTKLIKHENVNVYPTSWDNVLDMQFNAIRNYWSVASRGFTQTDIKEFRLTRKGYFIRDDIGSTSITLED